MLSRWKGWLAAATAALLACVLVILDLADAGLRRWWDVHALTTDTVAGLLVLLITVLVVGQVVRLRQVKNQVWPELLCLFTGASPISRRLTGSPSRLVRR